MSDKRLVNGDRGRQGSQRRSAGRWLAAAAAAVLLGLVGIARAPVPGPLPFAPDDLAATLPSEVHGKRLRLASSDSLVRRMQHEPRLLQFLSDRQLDIDDVLIAEAKWEETTQAGYAVVLIACVRIPGLSAEETDLAFTTPTPVEANGPSGEAVQDGKQIYYYTWSDGTVTFKYPKDEVLYVVIATDPSDAVAALAALP